MKFDPAQIKEAAKQDFDLAWQQGREYLGKPAVNDRYPRRTFLMAFLTPSSIPFIS